MSSYRCCLLNFWDWVYLTSYYICTSYYLSEVLRVYIIPLPSCVLIFPSIIIHTCASFFRIPTYQFIQFKTPITNLDIPHNITHSTLLTNRTTQPLPTARNRPPRPRPPPPHNTPPIRHRTNQMIRLLTTPSHAPTLLIRTNLR